jgi:hypothetical protein
MSSILTTIIVVVIGLVCMGVAKLILHVNNIGGLLTALVLPAIIYALVTGTLASFTMPGGIEARSAAASESRINLNSKTITAEEATIIEKSGIEHLTEALPVFRGANPIMLTLTLGHHGYNPGTLLTYVNALGALPNFKFLVLLDSDHRLVGYMSASVASQLLSNAQTAALMVNDVSAGLLDELTHFPGVVTKSLASTVSNRDALEVMAQANLDAAVVTDAERRVQGLVERSQVMSTLILAMAK